MLCRTSTLCQFTPPQASHNISQATTSGLPCARGLLVPVKSFLIVWRKTFARPKSGWQATTLPDLKRLPSHITKKPSHSTKLPSHTCLRRSPSQASINNMANAIPIQRGTFHRSSRQEPMILFLHARDHKASHLNYSGSFCGLVRCDLPRHLYKV